MNDELITRLRETAVELVTSLEPVHGEDIAADLSDAADALEAARAEIKDLEFENRRLSQEITAEHRARVDMHTAYHAHVTSAAYIESENRALRAERDAEAALADQLAEALRGTSPYVNSNPFNPYERAEGRDAALAAHRERRTKESQ